MSMLKDKKNLFIFIAIVVVLIGGLITFILLKDSEKNEGGDNKPNEQIVIPEAPAENTESLVQDLEKVEAVALTNNVIELPKNTEIKNGAKVAVWVYSTPKFLGYFEVVEENGAKVIKGLEKAMKDLDIESGEHNIAIVTEEGESVGYIDVYIEENKIFEDEEAAIVSKYTTEEVKEEVEVKFKTETKKDANKKSGSKEVVQAGVNGLKEITYKITYDENGKEIKKEKINEKTIKEVVNEIVVVGSADFNTNSSKITDEFIGFMCLEDQTMDYEGQLGCNDFIELSQFKAIVIDKTTNYVVTVNESNVKPFKITKSGSLYKGKYNGKTYYFDPKGKTYAKGTYAIVETARGLEYGEVSMTNAMVKETDTVPPIRPVIRAASPADVKHQEDNKLKEYEAFKMHSTLLIIQSFSSISHPRDVLTSEILLRISPRYSAQGSSFARSVSEMRQNLWADLVCAADLFVVRSSFRISGRYRSKWQRNRISL